MNLDRLNSVSPIHTVRDAVTLVDTLQHFPAEQQVAALAVAFALYAETLGMSPSELINKAQRIVRDADTHYTRHAKALRDYIREEVK